MTTTWPPAASAVDWGGIDRLAGQAGRVVDAESRRGGVHQVRWDPDRGTRVAFDRPDGEVVVLEVTPAATTRSTLAEDPALPGLRAILDPEHAKDRFGQLLGEPVRRCVTSTASYRPGSRCVVRAAVETGVGTRDVFVKVFAGGVEEYVESHESLAGARGTPVVPPLVGWWPDLSAVVTAAVPGPTASAVLGDNAVPAGERGELARSVGSLLARVHEVRPGRRTATHVHTAHEALDELAGYLPAAWHADPAVALSMTWAVGLLRRAVPDSTEPAFSHGSFRPGQVLVPGGGLVLLDLDGAGLADPARDLGNALAYVDWQHLRNPAAPPGLSSALREGYADGGGRVAPGSLDWWHAAALLKIAGRRYRSLDTTRWAQVAALVATATALIQRREAQGRGRDDYLRAGARPALTDPVSMTALLRPLLAGRGAGRATVTSARTVKVAPGRRVVARCHVTWDTGGELDVIAKAYAEPGLAAVTHENLTLLQGVVGGRVGTPRPLGMLADRGLILCAAADGRPLSDPWWDDRPAEVADVARRCGAWLRAVHASPIPLRRTLDVTHEAENLTRWAEDIGRADDRLRGPARELARRLRAVAADLPLVVGSPIHKDLHLGHVLVDVDGTATVIDLDEARMGDSALDLAHLCAYADETRSPAAGLAKASLLEAYGPPSGPAPRLRLDFFYAYSLLKITKQEARGGLTDAMVDRGAWRLERGASWLGG
ncbi:phosphotransferase family protein [Georgenia sp. SYP-B2076]|uniref:phosphotransferase family protein n=1 Tax=Georgenia sp. SYP-B2076 TaxID=2495881 RepID=UPI0013DF1F0F|nr:aminoglycoside phosphotransferase family protein [Georgenia sp. SYP-B2076]